MEPGLHTWVALGVLAVLLTLILASSCYDCYVHHQPTKEKRILVCFSVFVNLRKLVQSERHVDSLDVLDGLRFLAISWIVLGHRYHQCLQVPNLFLTYTEKYITAWFMSPVFNTMMAVELFFLLSGCLVTYHFLKERANGVKFNLFYFYYKRYVRLTPALATVMLLEGCLMYYASDGPLWKRLVGNRMDTCVDYWWTNLLYISNYVNPYRICVVQSWYLSADMQLYVLSPLLLLPLSRPGRCGLLLLAGCYLATTAAAFSNAFYNQLPAGGTATIDKKTEQNHGLEYVKTHVRAASWLTGVALGHILHMYRTSDHPWKMTKVTSAAAWTVSTLLCVTAVFSLAPFQQISYQYSPLRDSLYIALHRNCFSLGAAGVIFLCACGKGGFFNKFLGWGGFRPLATLSYGVYLCHMGLQMISLARIRQPYPFDMYSLFTDLLSDLVLANLMAALLYIGVEAPSWEVGRWFYNTRTAAKTATEKPCQSSINLDEERTVL